jgi:hypothetical protein
MTPDWPKSGLGGRSGRVSQSQKLATVPPGTPDLPLDTVADVARAALAITFNQARRGQVGVALANCLGQLAGQLLRATEGGDLERRPRPWSPTGPGGRDQQ